MKTPVEERAAKQLERGADRIERYGWRQLVFGSYNAGFCMLGALEPVGSKVDQKTVSVARNALAEVIRVTAPAARRASSAAIVHYNDFLAKSATEVTGVMRTAAAELRSV